MLELTPEQEVANDYKAAMDSVNLINGKKPEYETEEEWNATVARNKEHLSIMVAKDFWGEHDLAPLHAAIAK